ncbi:nuclear transport factor 2 family protein [Kitasatospora sp. DSM 101779]|uniref:nuclear transport factor 2 family protein n=1 Tax=Kitasatospora sp. DSM 101779 TaxID=2853165 RepID=UPI0021D81852|nr:nuclear transport factor 2 family protein [Kitasatospora sp. DSM 101779]MCU7820376.1 nuclear transport factor 2 family protein [Kitasatospora sp. DSM 101779]
MSRPSRATTTLVAAAALCTAATTATAAAQGAAGHPPRIVTAWACAWNGTDPRELGALFTVDGTYTDLAVGVTFRGRQEISGWKARADDLIANVHVTVRTTHRHSRRITAEAVYSGHLKAAPKAFAVPMTTLLDLDDHGRITSDRDHYDLATVLTRSGLPTERTPPTP